MCFLTTMAEDASVNITLLAVIAMFILFAVIDGIRGFIKSVYALVGVILAIILTIVLTPYTGAVLKSWDKPYNSVHDKVSEYINLSANDKYMENSEEAADGILDTLHLPDSVSTKIIARAEEIEQQTQLAVKHTEEYLTDGITDVIMDCVAFIGTFLIIFILIKIVFGLLGLAAKLPVIKQADKILGVAIGIVECLFIITLLSIAVTCLSSTEFGGRILEDIGQSSFLTFLYTNNWILVAVSGLSALIKSE